MDALIAFANKRRSSAATNINLHSSRSHLIVTVEVTSLQEATGEETVGKIHLVDLAGSERIAHSKVEGQQLKETISINQSLSALGDVIAARATESAAPVPRSTKAGAALTEADKVEVAQVFKSCSGAVSAFRRT